MKRGLILVFLLLLAIANGYSQDSTLTKRADSLILMRNQQYQQYQTKISGLTDSSSSNMKWMLLAKDSLLTTDQQILDELFPALREAIDSSSIRLELQKQEFSSQMKKYEWVDKYSSYFLPISIAIGLLVLLLLIFVISSTSSKKKWKKQWTQIKNEQAKTMDELTKMRSTVEQEEKDLSIQKQLIEKEKQNLLIENKTLAVRVEELSNKCLQHEAEAEKQALMISEKEQLEIKLLELNTLREAIENSEKRIKIQEEEKISSEQHLLKELSEKEKLIIEMQQEMIMLREKMENSDLAAENKKYILEIENLQRELTQLKENEESTRKESEEKIKYLQTLADEERAVRKEMEQVIKDFLNK